MFVLLLIAILALFPLYSRFKVMAAPIPPGVYLGGLELSALKDPDQIRQHLEPIYYETVGLYFGDKRLPLRPEEVDFQIDVDQMVYEASRYLEGGEFIDIAVREALGFSQQRRDIPVRFTLNNDKLYAWLTQAATAHNSRPTPPRGLPPQPVWVDGTAITTAAPPGYQGVFDEDWQWLPGEPGYELNIEASIEPVIAALTSPDHRTADLPLIEVAPTPPSTRDLAAILNSYTADFPGFAAIYLHDLTTDEETVVDPDIAFSGMSTMKIAIALAVIHKLDGGIQADDTVSEELGQLLDYALGESNNHAANQLLRWLGDGDIGTGTRQLTDFMRELGFVSTYMQSGYDVDIALPEIPTPGNQRDDWDTNPDTTIQSTPREMGQILSAIYQCMNGKGLLIERYADTITPDECETILFYMTHDEFQELIWGGLPDKHNRWIVHKHGFAFESHSDVALIWGPTGPYVLSIFFFRSGWMDWATSNSRMQGISRGIWRFYEFQHDALAIKPPKQPLLQPPPGYVKLKEYIPVVSSGGE
ncbi:MAG: serine hydrolase [Caldilineaceae bacterium]